MSVNDYSAYVRRRWSELGELPRQAPWDQNTARFTRCMAYELRTGWNGAPCDPSVGLWQKRSASTIDDRDPDKLVFLVPGGVVFVDIVVSGGAPNASPGWAPTGVMTGGPAACPDPLRCQGWVEAAPEPGIHDAPVPVPEPAPASPMRSDPVAGPDVGVMVQQMASDIAALRSALAAVTDQHRELIELVRGLQPADGTAAAVPPLVNGKWRFEASAGVLGRVTGTVG